MECDKAGSLMMKYMDGSLSKKEAEMLKAHIDGCEACREDFAIYDEMLAEFKDLEIIEAPEGFEEAVMLKIEALEPVSVKSKSFVDNIIYGVCGVFSVLFGLGFILFMNRTEILEYLSANGMSSYVGVLLPFSNLVTEYTSNIVFVANTAFSGFGSFLAAYKYIILAVFTVLVLAQHFISARFIAHKGVKAIEFDTMEKE